MLIHLADVPRGHEDHADKEDQVVAGGGHVDGGGPALLQTLQHGTQLTKLQAGQDQVPAPAQTIQIYFYTTLQILCRESKMLLEEVTTSHWSDGGCIIEHYYGSSFAVELNSSSIVF